ncbi:hypothetical protein [Streptomyces sp. NPDC007264]|uniref:hypothetical protein n=1 Tax=Streptomyces sp. NPDC007264 TaxID=3364777 RepID=UPI0036DF0434
MDDPGSRPLRPSGFDVGGVVERPELPDLLRARDAGPWRLPLLQHRPSAARMGRRRHAGQGARPPIPVVPKGRAADGG